MKRTIIKSIVCLLTAVIAASLIFTSVSAASDPYYDDNYSDGKQVYVEWELTEDMQTLKGDDVTYTLYNTPIMSDIVAKRIYGYTDSIRVLHLQESEWVIPYSYEKGGEIVWLGYDANMIYVTESGREHLDSFYSGKEVSYVLSYRDYGYNNITAALLSRLEGCDGEKVTFELPMLAKYDEYVISACDTKKIIGYPVGSVFDIGGDYYYVNHADLDNSYFDADGNISFRKGTIELVKCSSVHSDISNSISHMQNVYTEYSFEWEYGSGYYDDEGELIHIGWHAVVCPAGGVAAGLIIPQSKRLGKPKKWYSVAILSGIILVLSLMLMII